MNTFSLSGYYTQDSSEIFFDGAFVLYEDNTIKGVLQQTTSNISLTTDEKLRGLDIFTFYLVVNYDKEKNEIQFVKFSTINSDHSFFDTIVLSFNGSNGEWKTYSSPTSGGDACINIEERHLSYKSILVMFYEGAFKQLYVQERMDLLLTDWKQYVKEHFL